ncbi:MAG: hypothetical protein AMJ43_04110 [Coxiella sp. DG_40]|nr:MAG: hypothetical protein AMJ43_04110 [Coxiella sp. DG_40]
MNNVLKNLDPSTKSEIKHILYDTENRINQIIDSYPFIKDKNIIKANLSKSISELLCVYKNKYLEYRYPNFGLTADLGDVVRTRLIDFLKHIRTNLLNNVNKMLFRLHEFYEGIIRFFFENEKLDLVNIQLIKPNDFNEDNRRLVAILEFNEGKKILYKNSNVSLDMCLVGNIKHLSDNYVCPDSEKIFNTIKISASELINDCLKKTVFHDCILPTYKILSFNNNEPEKACGFMEYLSHNPPIEYKKLKGNGSFKQLIIKELEDKLEKFNGTCDYIINSEEEGEKFSFRFGAIFAFLKLFQIYDSHGGNFITHNNTPYIIDIETAFSEDAEFFEYTDLKDIYYAYEITDCDYNYNIYEKPLNSKIYYCDNNHKLEEYKINKDKFLQGFDMVFQIVDKHKNDLMNWLMKLKELNLIRRVIVATENIEVAKEYVEFLVSDDGKGIFSKYVLKSICDKARSGEVEYKECLAFIKSLPKESRKIFMQTLDENFTNPFFYAYITDKNIFQLSLSEKIYLNIKPYNNISGFDVVKSNINDFSDEKLLELHDLIDKYFRNTM